MLTKSDFLQAMKDTATNYPSVSTLLHAGDPRILMALESMATMLAMFSSQVEVAQVEGFEKTRNSTILADAAMRGILRKGTPSRFRLTAVNTGAESCTIESGRVVLDTSGRACRIETSAVIPAGGTGYVDVRQVTTSTVTHTVAGSEAFYSIPIPDSDDGSFLCGVAVQVGADAFEYRNRYVNATAGDKIFHIEADDKQQLYVRFGIDNVVGVQPKDGDVVTLTVSYTVGKIVSEYGSPYAFDYIANPAELSVELKMESLLEEGQDPISMSMLRDMARYPSVYDDAAVYQGEFDALVRKNFPTLQFLSVWNELQEELSRSSNLDNMNALFVACVSHAGGEPIQDDPDAPISIIPEEDLTETQKRIKETILRADDSYRVYFYPTKISKIKISISAWVSTTYVAEEVRKQIIELLVNQFGKQSPGARRGKNRPLYKTIYAALKKSVPALQDGDSDCEVSIEGHSASINPEIWRYVDDSSLNVVVQTGNIVNGTWNG